MALIGQPTPVGRQRLRKRPDDYVELMADYSCDMPLWGTVDWERELALSAALLDRLVAWQLRFDSNFRYDRGWTDDAERETWTRDADALCADLRREIPSDIPLVVDLWQIEPSKPWRRFWEPRGAFIYLSAQSDA